MRDVEAFWELGTLSDEQLLESVRAVLGSGRRLLAELVAHLAEVEERRLHLQAASSSMFHYCVMRLGLSEDEACRRIEVARLARRYPMIFPLLASGELSLSVAALLKPHVSMENHAGLLAAVRGKSVQQAREVLATLFPQPDVPSSLRKLPDRSAAQRALASAAPLSATPPSAIPLGAAQLTRSPSSQPSLLGPPIAPPLAQTSTLPEACPVARSIPPSPRSAGRLEPLSAERYKVQFTASAQLKAKLELARDLMRHAHPSGDFAPIVERALDLLIEGLMKRRFGSAARHRAANSPAVLEEHATCNPEHSPPVEKPARPLAPRQLSRAARRTALDRDGLGCSWVGEQGVRCSARAWLEHDHQHPRAKGGGSEPDNVRLLCRAHNRLAAELEYGEQYIERAVARRRQQRPERRRKPANAEQSSGQDGSESCWAGPALDPR